MFSFIRRHQYLAMVFILLVIVSFVFFFTDRSVLDLGGNVDLGSVNGRKITQREYLNAQKEAMLTHFFRYRDWPRPGSIGEQMGWKLEEQTMERLVLANQLKEKNIIVGDEAVAKQVAQFFRGGDSQATVQEQYRNFVDNRLKPEGITDEDFRRFIRNELGIAQLGVLFSAGGRLLSPAVAEAAYRHDNQQVETKAVVFQATNFVSKAKADVDPKALGQYYSNQVANYNLPTRVQVSYVAFEAINYLAEAAQEMAKNTNLTAAIEQQYKKDGAEAHRDEKGTVLTADKAKEKMRDDLRNRIASRIAGQKAYEFAAELLAIEPTAMANLNTLAGKKGVKVFETEPFAVMDGPKGIKDSEQLARQAFGLDRDHPFGVEPVQAGDNYYVLGFKNKIPSIAQPFEVVKAKVEEDYIQYRSSLLARDAGINFALAVTNGLTAGKKFADIAKEQKVKVISLAPFGRQATSIPELEAARVSPFQFRSAAFARAVGESSDFIPSGDGGFVLVVEKFLPADETKMKAELKDYILNLRSRQASTAYNEWVADQFQSAGVTISRGK